MFNRTDVHACLNQLTPMRLYYFNTGTLQVSVYHSARLLSSRTLHSQGILEFPLLILRSHPFVLIPYGGIS